MLGGKVGNPCASQWSSVFAWQGEALVMTGSFINIVLTDTIYNVPEAENRTVEHVKDLNYFSQNELNVLNNTCLSPRLNLKYSHFH